MRRALDVVVNIVVVKNARYHRFFGLILKVQSIQIGVTLLIGGVINAQLVIHKRIHLHVAVEGGSADVQTHTTIPFTTHRAHTKVSFLAIAIGIRVTNNPSQRIHTVRFYRDDIRPRNRNRLSEIGIQRNSTQRNAAAHHRINHDGITRQRCSRWQ